MATTRVRGSTGIELTVRLAGDETAPPIALLHALGETSESWDALIPELAKRYRVASFDLRGHGASDWPGVYSAELMRDDVIAAVDALGFDHFTLAGHSLGGIVALLLAEQLGDRVTQLVIEDAVPAFPREPRPVPDRPDHELPFDWAVLEWAYGSLSDPEQRDWPPLATITAPTLVVGGGASSHIPSTRIDEMAELIPECTVVTIDVGHHIHARAPKEFAAAVLPWLAD